MAIIHLGNGQLRGLSTDTKPIIYPAGATFSETDTGAQFYYNGTAWVAVTGGGGTVSPAGYNFDTIVYKDATTTYAISKTGSTLASGTAGSTSDDLVINTAVQNTPANGTLLIMPDNYTVGTNALPIIPVSQNANSEILFTNDITIFAYGVTLTANASVPHLATHLLKPAIGKSVAIYGMTIDLNRSYAVGFGTNVGNEAGKLSFIDGKILNIYSYGILPGNTNTTVNVNSELYVENSYFDAGGVVSNNECIAARCNQKVTLKNCIIYGNKALHLSSRYITLHNVWCDGTAYSGLSEMSPINGEFIDCRNIYMKDLALSLRPFLSMDGQTGFANCKQCTVSGYVHVEAASVMNGIELKGYEVTTGGTPEQMENCTIENFNLSRGGVFLLPHAQASSGTVKNLTIRNGYMNAVSGSNRILIDNNININLLTIENVQIGTYSTATEAPIYLLTNIGAGRDSDVTIGRCKLSNITPESTQYIIRASDNASGVAKTVTVTMEEPLQNLSQQIITSGAAVLVVKFRKNRGKFITNGNASTTTFTIPHSLISSPNTNGVRVNAGHADSRGSIDVSADATNIIVNFASAPPTGTNNVVLYWSAETG